MERHHEHGPQRAYGTTGGEAPPHEGIIAPSVADRLAGAEYLLDRHFEGANPPSRHGDLVSLGSAARRLIEAQPLNPFHQLRVSVLKRTK